jgi:ring-1,2-phenylacetyl-CoA epoxidase subunit PaaC
MAMGGRRQRMNNFSDNLKQALTQLLLSIADDKLMLGHRNSDWTGLGPILEEDIAFSHLAQDEIAHAQAIYEFLGSLIGARADDLAFGRKPEEYRCATIVEVPDEFDWATALCRQFFCDHFDRVRFDALSNSSLKPLADLSRRIAAEEQIHEEHSDGWMKRLGKGGTESRDRMQKALAAISPSALTLFEPTEGLDQLVMAGVYPVEPSRLFLDWGQSVSDIAAAAGLKLSLPPSLASSPFVPKGGRSGVHTADFKPLLDEMCEVYRLEPGAAW